MLQLLLQSTSGKHDDSTEFNGQLVLSSIYTFHKYSPDSKLSAAHTSTFSSVSQACECMVNTFGSIHYFNLLMVEFFN